MFEIFLKKGKWITVGIAVYLISEYENILFGGFLSFRTSHVSHVYKGLSFVNMFVDDEEHKRGDGVSFRITGDISEIKIPSRSALPFYINSMNAVVEVPGGISYSLLGNSFTGHKAYKRIISRENVKVYARILKDSLMSIGSIFHDEKTKRRQILKVNQDGKIDLLINKESLIIESLLLCNCGFCLSYIIVFSMVKNKHEDAPWRIDGDTRMSITEREKKFEYVYRDFFNSHNVVLSGHSVLTWGADISHGASALRIKQKLPMKIFCGANLNNSGKVTFGNFLGYASNEDAFQEDVIRGFSLQESEKISLFLQKFLTANAISQGIDIDILSEVPSGHGFASSGVISVLLTFLVHIVAGKLDSKLLVYQELFLHTELMEELYRFSLGLSNCISEGNSVGATNYAVMIEDTALPIVHFSHKNEDSDTRGGNIMNDDNTDIHIPIQRTLYKDVLTKFLGIAHREDEELPVDYGIIFTGLLYRFSDITRSRQNKSDEEEGIVSRIGKMVDTIDMDDADRRILSEILYTQKDIYSIKNTDATDLKILSGFNELLSAVNTESGVENFIQVIQQVGLLSFSYQKENKLLSAFQYLFHEYAQFPDEDIAILPFNSGKIGGSLLFVIKKGRSQSTIEKVLNKLTQDGYIASLDYVSWKDGYASNGVQIEQYISEKIYSQYTKEGDLLFIDTLGREYSGEYDAILRNENEGILLDTIGGRVYIKGVKLTSKEIHSQNTSIDMLKILIENIGKEVSNTKLPVSTYSQNKNEILGKIILPLKKLVKKNFGVELSLTCSGGITDYYLKLERDEGVSIGIIGKLYE